MSDELPRKRKPSVPAAPVPSVYGPEVSVSDVERYWKALFDRLYEPYVKWVSWEVRSRDAAEDIVQGALVDIWQTYFRDGAPHKESLDGLLYTKVRDRIRKDRKQKAKRSKVHAMLAAVPQWVRKWMQPHEGYMHQQMAMVMESTVSEMSERCREAFIMKYEGGLKHEEIARAMGLTISSVQTYLNRAHALMAERLNARGLGPDDERPKTGRTGRAK